MPTLAWISGAAVAGSVISIAIAALFALSAPASWVPALVSFAIGALLGAVFLEILPHAIGSQQWIGTVLALAAASMIYVAVDDLIPGLHRWPELHATAQQVTLIALGVGVIWLVGDLVRAA
ncbi:MAG TPA: hypothetical protein VMI74_15185 [Burkholderiales bacterium]|nr:hypothetical protein [Burkholderiales bacterium]